ncbi:hypothetical protein K1516_19285 [Stenotrophomonas maltophilia]|uniref:hypothetical protein n=1 Tax=Stenotrophomonas maltophilia group TaxID=995085 RepID=UPI00200D65F3|nr:MULTISPECIES: hypothetical protein [Stenotrophomonas maltophilia group]UQA70047.1 hypothetical protein K1516_19285 [Stenotrophomonas maltophilia]HDS1826686.1 hypothetical protein [Stenotrophomonas maltophilia]
MRLVLQPCGNTEALRHYQDTVSKLVPMSRVLPHLPSDEADAVAKTFGDEIAIWGVTPGEGNANVRYWKQMAPGDICLFYRDGRFFMKGVVTYSTHNRALAEELWGARKKDGATWEYVFFLDDLETIDLPISDFNDLSGYAPKYRVQRFSVLSEDLSSKILSGLPTSDYLGPQLLTKERLNEAQDKLKALAGRELDSMSKGARRVEQQLLRSIHLGGMATAPCTICGRMLPVDLLVIGHIQKRSKCSAEQKLDQSNVMPVCLAGCDRLFENGYIYVDGSGTIRSAERKTATPDVNELLSSIIGKICSNWNEKSAPYYQLHADSARTK